MSIFSQSEIAELVKSYGSALSKAPSVTTSTGLNFLPLEEEARNTYPVFHPVLDMIPRVTPEELGHEVGGLSRPVEASRNPRLQHPSVNLGRQPQRLHQHPDIDGGCEFRNPRR